MRAIRTRGISGDPSSGVGIKDKPKCLRQRLRAFSMESLTAISRSLLPLPTVVNHQQLL